MNLSDFKKKVHAVCAQQIDARINELEALIADARASSQNETKSSAGDKHETARAMAHLEEEKNQQSLQQFNKMRQAFQQQSHTLVYTCKGYFYISVALGKVEVDGKPVMVISPASPLGSELLTLGENEQTEVNNIQYTAISIW